MTAGRGIVHSEMPANNEQSHGLQLWVNLKSKDKMIEPAYQELKAKDIKKVTQDGITAIVIAGTALGTTSQVYTRTPTHYIHFMMDANKELKQPIDKKWNAFLYTLEGSISVDGSESVGPHHTIALTRDDNVDGVTVTTKSEKASFVLLAGEPTNEPVVQHGPFVMNTREQIMQAFTDYQYGKNGFERAPGWKSEIGRPITDKYHDEM